MKIFEIPNVLKTGELTPGAVLPQTANEILLVTGGGDTVSQFMISDGKNNPILSLLPGQSRLLWAAQVTVTLISGLVHCRRFCRMFFAKLLAFLDQASGIGEVGRAVPSLIWLEAPVEAFHDRRHAEYWLLQQTSDDAAPLAGFLALLRHTEAYGLVRYLLEHSNTTANLAELGARYGLSYSHFRRVCKQALGSNAKSALKNWRVARSLLEIGEQGMSLTDVALKYGYASSSHFSTEIKDIFGVSPRGLADIAAFREGR